MYDVDIILLIIDVEWWNDFGFLVFFFKFYEFGFLFDIDFLVIFLIFDGFVVYFFKWGRMNVVFIIVDRKKS